MTITKELLSKLGLKTAVKGLERAEKLQRAYENYMYISQECVNDFNAKLREDTLKEDKRSRSYKRLNFIPLGEYTDIPPKEALDKLEKAQNDFDYFQVCKVEWHKEVKDPIIFGRIEGCTDYFHIAQWDDDIYITDFIANGYQERTSKKKCNPKRPKK